VIPELPLLKRELIESAQHLRTYVLRVVMLCVMALVFLLLYAEVTRIRRHPLDLLGQGYHFTVALLIFTTCAIYALLPAMACSAITFEKEKQTLGLLLASRLRPGTIIMEKTMSRLMPILSLLVIASPLFAVAYLFGGVSLAESAAGILIVLMIAVHVVALAIFCSTVFQTGLAAFWATYVILGFWYFTVPIYCELARYRPFRTPDSELFLCAWYPLVLLVDRRPPDLTKAFLFTCPTNLATIGLLVASRFTLTRFGMGNSLSVGKLLQHGMGWFRAVGRSALNLVLNLLPWRRKPQWFTEPETTGPGRPLDDTQTLSIAWREKRRVLLHRPFLIASICAAPLALEFLYMLDHAGRSSWTEEGSAFTSFILQIVILLVVMGLGCRLFAMERERQTIDSLLTMPIPTRQILSQKLAGINRLTLIAIIPIFVAGLMNVLFTEVEVYDELGLQMGIRHRWRNDVVVVPVWSPGWFVASFRFLVCVVGNALIYIQIVKWVSVYCGLRLPNQMKAMLASLLSILGLCILPILVTTLFLISLDLNPDDFPVFWFTSPVPMAVLNEIHEIDSVFRRSWFPNSEWLVVLTNFAVYGTLAVGLRAFVLARLNKLLQRRDSHTQQPGEHTPITESASATVTSLVRSSD
jgi:ABC-type transport system involved in multi-copper enzyme maturation permease subunit